MRVTAIVVARGGSRRVPGKALRPFGASTLIGHKVDQLRQCREIGQVVVGSDDREILAEAERHGAETRLRDDYHCDESKCSANEMIRNMAAMVDCDVVVWAHPTNPLCLPDIYDAALTTYHDVVAKGMNDSLCSVTPIQRHAWRAGRQGEIRQVPVNFNPWGDCHPLASELETTYYQDGAIFIQPHQQMLGNGYFYGDLPHLFPVAFPYGFDVDTERDLKLAQHIWNGSTKGVPA